MSENNESIKIFKCNICIKSYASQSSLCNHNKRFHKSDIHYNIASNIISNIVSDIAPNIIEKKYNCKHCTKIFNDRRNKWRHEQICKQKLLNNNNISNNNKLEKLEKENIEIKNEKIEDFFISSKKAKLFLQNMLKELLEKNCKIHPKTLNKINKQLINNHINNGTINNGPVINNTYVKFGNEQLSTLLKHKDMLKIINKQCLCIEESIKTVQLAVRVLEFPKEIVHFNKSFPEYNNIFITNMKDTIAYIFDGIKFIITSKDDVINNLYNSHLENIEQFLEEVEIPFIKKI
jgi:hypothetical protein